MITIAHTGDSVFIDRYDYHGKVVQVNNEKHTIIVEWLKSGKDQNVVGTRNTYDFHTMNDGYFRYARKKPTIII